MAQKSTLCLYQIKTKNDMSLTKELTPSNEYTQETIRLIAECLRRADKQVRAHCIDLYKSVVVRARGEFPTDHPSLKAIETLVRGCANDADAIRDVCSDTHSYLCGVSKVYSYSEDALASDEDTYDAVGYLVEDYINDLLDDKGRYYNEDNRHIEFYISADLQTYQVGVD